jgi:hypothetical protein
MKGFLTVIFNMVLIRKPSITNYWQKRFGSTNTPWFHKMFSRNRFQLIYRFFHLVNHRVTPQRNSDFYDPAAWFKPIMQHANNVFKRYISPNREPSVDEALVGHKFGIKLWVLIEAVSGYIIHFFPYRGRRYDPVPNGEIQGTHVVMKLLRESDLLGKWHARLL